jgi:predicted nuclease of predicted toxin-antitoxin system
VKPRFLLDEHISPKVARLAAKRGVDARAVADSELAGLKDAPLFRTAIAEGRILVTYNIDDMSILLSDLLKEGADVPGVVFVDIRTISVADVVGLSRALVRLARKLEVGELQAGGGIFLQRG